ncbi:MAG: NAD(P)H-binding protein [Gemmatimonadota bacterium]
MTTVFVAGATGYTGREVVRELVQRGMRTIPHVRPDSSVLNDWVERFRQGGAEADTTPWTVEALRTTLASLRPDVIFSLLGTTQSRSRAEGRSASAQGYEEVDYGLTAMLLHAVLDAGIQPKFVYLSAAGVREDTSNPYLAVRWRLEQELIASGLPYLIARPSFITGPDRDEARPVERIAAAVVDGVLTVARLFGADLLRERYRSTTNVVLASALVRLARAPGSERTIVPSEALR